MKKYQMFLMLALALSSASAYAQNKTSYHVLKTMPIASTGGWDYLTVDGPGKLIYTSHGNQINVLSTAGDSVGYIPNTPGVHGIVIMKTLGKGYISAGRANAVVVFDLKTFKILNQIPVGQNPDAIFYDDFSKKIITCNGRSKDATILDPITDKVVATVPLGDKPETAVSDGKGKIFVNGETSSSLIVFDATTYKEVARYKINGGEEPSGLDIDRQTNRLFVACAGSKTMVIIDAANGKTVAKFPIGDSDGLVFDHETKIAYAANVEGNITTVHELSANKFELIETIKTEPSARTIAIDPITHRLYLPAAKMEPGATGSRPKTLPGTFHIIEVGK